MAAPAAEMPVTVLMREGFLAGTLHLPGGKRPRRGWPAVLMCHGFTGNRIESHFLFVKASRHFAAQGLASLRFDFRGSGESSGRFRDMSVLTELADALAAWEFLGRQREVDADRRGLVGLSFGGAVSSLLAAGLAAEDRPPRCVALWSAVADIVELWQRRTGKALGAGGRLRFPLEMSGHQVGRRFFADMLRVPRPAEALGSAGVPALVVQGTADEAVPVSHGRLFRKMSPRSRLVVLRGFDHTFNSTARERKVIGLTARWLRGKI